MKEFYYSIEKEGEIPELLDRFSSSFKMIGGKGFMDELVGEFSKMVILSYDLTEKKMDFLNIL